MEQLSKTIKPTNGLASQNSASNAAVSNNEAVVACGKGKYENAITIECIQSLQPGKRCHSNVISYFKIPSQSRRKCR